MAIAWFMCPYRRDDVGRFPGRVCAMSDYTAQIAADGGAWSEIEVLDSASPSNGGTAGWAVVKVRASDATISTISGQPEFLYLLGDTPLDTAMSAMTTQQRNVISTRLLTQGYTQAEIDAALGTTLNQWRSHTYRDLLNLAASRRLTEHYDAVADAFFCDGAPAWVKPVTSVDGEVV